MNDFLRRSLTVVIPVLALAAPIRTQAQSNPPASPGGVTVNFWGFCSDAGDGNTYLAASATFIPGGGEIGVGPGYMEPIACQMRPGVVYTINVSADANAIELYATSNPNYVVLFEDNLRGSESLSLGGGYDYTGVMHVCVVPANPAAIRAGTASSITSGQVVWQVSLGSTLNGNSAGVLALSDPGTEYTWAVSPIFVPSGLQFHSSSAEIVAHYTAQGLSQVYGDQADVDVVQISQTMYEIRFYNPSARWTSNGTDSQGNYTFTQYPYVVYQVGQGSDTNNPGNPNVLTITKITFSSSYIAANMGAIISKTQPIDTTNPGIANIEYTQLERTGYLNTDYVWVLQDWHKSSTDPVPVETRTWSDFPVNVDPNTIVHLTAEQLTLNSGNSSSSVYSAKTIYGQFPWGVECIEADKGDGTVDPVSTTSYEFETDNSDTGGFGLSLNSSSNDGSYVSYQYAPWEVSGNAMGVISSVNHPANFNGNATQYETTSMGYTLDAFGILDRQTSITTTVGDGQQIGNSSISYVDPVIQVRDTYPTGSTGTLNIVQATRTDYAGAGNAGPLVTVNKYYREDSPDDFYASQPFSSVGPDGVQKSYAYTRGTYNGPNASPVFTAANSGDGSAIAVITGVSPSATTAASTINNTAAHPETTLSSIPNFGIGNYSAIDPIVVVDGKSKMEVTFRDSSALVQRTETYVWSSGDWKLISYVNYGYDVAGMLTQRVYSNGGEYDATYAGDELQSETDETGIVTNYTYDAEGRVASSAKVGGPTTSYTYDAAGHVTQKVVSNAGLSLTSNWTYDTAGRLSSETPAGLGTTSYTYSYVPVGTAAWTKTTHNPDGGTRIEGFQADGRPASLTGSAVVARYSSYSDNPDGSITAYVSRGNGAASTPRTIQTTTDALGRLISTVQPSTNNQTNVVTNKYEAGSGRLVEVDRTGVAPTLYFYDPLGNLVRTGLNLGGGLSPSSTDRMTDSDQFVEMYNGDYWLHKETDVYPVANSAAQVTQSITREHLTGLPANRLQETQSLDVFGNLTVRTVDVTDRSSATVTVTTTFPDSSSNQVETIKNGLSTKFVGKDGLTTLTAYDGLDRPGSVTDPRNNTTTTAYYSNSNLVDTITDATGTVVHTYTYDSMGRQLSDTNAQGNVTNLAYDYVGRITGQSGNATYQVSYVYDPIYGDRKQMSTFRTGGTADTTSWCYDAASGLLLSKTDPLGGVVNYAYNTQGQITARTWARGVTTSYSYDPQTGEMTGVNYSDGTPNVSYTYTRLGQTASVTDSAQTRTFTYSASTLELQSETLSTYFGNRILKRSYETSVSGAIGRGTGFDLGTSVTQSSDGSIGYGYDSNGRLDEVSVGSGPSFAYSYLSNSDLIATVGDSADQWAQTRSWVSNRNLLASIQTANGTTTFGAFQYSYDNLGRRTSKVSTGALFSRYPAGGLAEDYVYDSLNQLKTATTYQTTTPSNTSEPVLGRTLGFNYDGIGNRTSTAVDSNQTSYSDNAGDELVSRSLPGNYSISGFAPSGAAVTVNGNTVAAAQKQGDFYQVNVAASNSGGPQWTQFAVASSAGGSISQGAFLPQSPQVYSYDADGNLLSDGRWHYDWDGENRLITMETIGNRPGDPTAVWNSGVPKQKITFAYDYLGRRIDKTLYTFSGGNWVAVSASGETRFVYDGWNLIADYDATGGNFGTLLHSYAWGLDFDSSLQSGSGGGLLAVISASGVINLPVYDGNGNVMGLTDHSTGAVNATYEYSPFGEVLRSVGLYAQDNRIRFSTQYTDGETSLVYYGRRYYNPHVGRWLSRDPIGEIGGNNLYGFCGNDGVDSRDLGGLQVIPPFELNPPGTGFPVYQNGPNQSGSSDDIAPGVVELAAFPVFGNSPGDSGNVQSPDGLGNSATSKYWGDPNDGFSNNPFGTGWELALPFLLPAPLFPPVGPIPGAKWPAVLDPAHSQGAWTSTSGDGAPNSVQNFNMTLQYIIGSDYSFSASLEGGVAFWVEGGIAYYDDGSTGASPASAPNSSANTQLYGLMVTLPDGTQYMPITQVKNQAQADVLGLPIGSIIPIMAPANGADIMSNLMTQAGQLNVFDTSAFKNMWSNTPDNPNNFKVSLQPTGLYDQFGNFAYGATAEAVGYPQWFTQWAGAYGRNGSLTGNNLPINQLDIGSGYNAAQAGGTYSVTPVNFGGPGP